MHRHSKGSAPAISVAPEFDIHDVSAGTHSRRLHRKDDANAFIPDPYDMSSERHMTDDEATDMAETRGEEYITAITANVDITEQQLDQLAVGEYGGPYTISTVGEEMAVDEDASNPPDATREPFPAPMRATGELAPKP